MKPYYDHEKRCECGCGQIVQPGRRFISGHNLRFLKKTEKHCKNISEAQKKAWKTKRKRMPVGSRYVDSNGYVRIKMLTGAGRWKYEHKLIMEEHIGRELKEREVVHHINKIPSNNRIENLYLCSSQSHHNKIENTVNLLLETLINNKIILFDRRAEKYVLT